MRELNSETDSDRNFILVMIVALVVLLAKLVFSYHVFGTNDMMYWMDFSRIIRQSGTFEIYGLVRIYNHPPLVSWMLKLIAWFSAETGLGFPFVFRLLPICADFTGVLVLWKLLELYEVKNRMTICVICALNPVNFFISAFHGNTDPVFVFLIILSIYLVERQSFVPAGVVYGVSLCVKVVPLILIPAYFLGLPGRKARLQFFLSALIIPVVSFAPYLATETKDVISNIFFYSSYGGSWGMGYIFRMMAQSKSLPLVVSKLGHSLYELHLSYGKYLILAMIVLCAKFFMDARKTNLAQRVFLLLAIFLIVTPGFGAQYLCWISLFAVMLFPWIGAFYACVGGVFLYTLYTYWSGGFPMNVADSNKFGWWPEYDGILGLALWLSIIVMAVKLITTIVRPLRTGEESSLSG